MQEQPILCERDGAVALIRLNRPEKHNAINRALSVALTRTMEELEADPEIHAIVIAGAGDRAFCAGADMGERGGGEEAEGGPADGLGAVLRATKPTIAAVNGYAYGGGARLAVSTDIRIASPTAKFRFVSVSYGLVACGTELPPIVGSARARELIYTARVVDAEECERIGLVNKIVPQDQLIASAMEMAKQIAANSPQAVQWAKRVINAATTIEKGLEVEIQARSSARDSEDHSTRFQEASARITGRSG